MTQQMVGYLEYLICMPNIATCRKILLTDLDLTSENNQNDPTPLRRGWILAALMVTMTLAAMDNTIVSTAIPQIVGDLGGFSLFSWVFSVYLLVQTITIPLYGKLADMYGRKPILIFGIALFLAGSALCALAWNMYTLIFFRGVQALGAGAIMVTVSTLAGDLYNIQERAKIQGWLSSVWGRCQYRWSGGLGGAFAEYLSRHWIFIINLPARSGLFWLESMSSYTNKNPG